MRYLMRNRLFTFGCSFTEYRWPTWANILGQNFDQFENWGQPGGGNTFILNSLMECINRNIIQANDTVIIMWTSIGREDRWVKGRGWVTVGSIYNQIEYDKNFVSKWADPLGYLIRDMASISATKQVLERLGCSWHFLSLGPLEYYDDSKNFKHDFSIIEDIKELYKDELAAIKPSVYDVVFDGNWGSRNSYKPLVNDDHPTTKEHLMYLNKVLPEYNINNNTLELIEIAEATILSDEPTGWQGWNYSKPKIRF